MRIQRVPLHTTDHLLGHQLLTIPPLPPPFRLLTHGPLPLPPQFRRYSDGPSSDATRLAKLGGGGGAAAAAPTQVTAVLIAS